MVTKLKNERDLKRVQGISPGGKVGNTHLGLNRSQLDLGIFLLRIHPKENSKH